MCVNTVVPTRFSAHRTVNEWKQVALYNMKMLDRQMASDYQPTRLPYGITRLLARSTTPYIARMQVIARAQMGRHQTYREVERLIKHTRSMLHG
jgi:hypothetical protein